MTSPSDRQPADPAGSAQEPADPVASHRPYVDALSLNGVDEQVYEAIVTLENTGQPTSQAAIAAATGLDDATLDQTLRGLAERTVIVASHAGGEPAYAPARRDWSAAPAEPEGGLARS